MSKGGARTPERKGHGKALPVKTWAKLLDAFRGGASAYAAAIQAGVNYRTAQKAYDLGLEVRGASGAAELKPSIRSVLEAERTGARAARAATEPPLVTPPAGGYQAPPAQPPAAPAAVGLAIAAGRVPGAQVRELAGADVVAAIAEEARLVRFSRSNAAGLVASTANLLAGVTKLSLRLQVAIGGLTVGTKIEDVNEALRVVGAVAVTAQLTTKIVREVLRAERMLLGDPKAAPSAAGAPASAFEATAEEAGEELARLAPFVEKYGPLRVIKGGAAQGDGPATSGEEKTG